MKLIKASKILHAVVLLSCFLPAIMPSCSFGGPTKEDIERREKALQDSMIEVATAYNLKVNAIDSAYAENKTDTSFVDTTATITNADTLKTDTSKTVSAADTLQTNKTKKTILEKAFGRLIMPDEDNYSLMGYVLLYSAMSSPAIFMLLLIWAIGLRFTSSNHKLIFIQAVIGFLALSLYASSDYVKDVMWGFWVVYVLSLFNAILNWRIYFDAKKNKQTNVWGDL